MEYLMTYGWAILIIAVVLGALFSLGVFSGNSLLGNACVASSGFLCQNPIYSHATSNIVVSLGQNTGTTWDTAFFVFVPQGTPVSSGIPQLAGNVPIDWSSVNGPPVYGITQGLVSGQTQTVTLPVNSLGIGYGNTITVGTSATGAIWAEYTTSVSGTKQYAQIATINIKAS
ncbi:MAG: hypothetical protein ACREBH_03905 [Candidatus Micrarchaeaceae archaeon]